MSTYLSRRAVLSSLGAACAGALLVPDLSSLFGAASQPSNSLYKPIARQIPVLGTRVTVVVAHPDHELAGYAIRRAERALFEIHSTMTRHEPSLLTALNRFGAHEAQVLPASILAVLERSREIHDATGGLFDATMGRLTREVQQLASRSQRFPTDRELAHLHAGTGWQQVHVEPETQSVSFSHPNTELDFDGIAKGYAVDRAVLALREQGMEHFLVNAGGDLYAAGVPGPDQEGWRIRVETPNGGRPAHTLVISNRAVATSGNCFRPKLPDGQVIRHLLNPRLARPSGRFSSATVVAESAMDADAWATAAFIGKPAEVEALARQRGRLQALLVDLDGRVIHLAT